MLVGGSSPLPLWPSSLHARDDEPGSDDDDNYSSSSLDSSADGSDEHELKSNTKLKSRNARHLFN
jgi:hypothetical protein